MLKKINTRLLLLLAVITLAGRSPVSAQGPLQPPTAPTPEGKTTQQIFDKAEEARVQAAGANANALAAKTAAEAAQNATQGIEARTAIRQSNIPLVISQPGSYVVAQPLTFSAATGNAITINASQVTLDLNGFSLTGPGKTFGNNVHAIVAAAGQNAIAVFNGSIRAFNGHGADLSGAANAQLHGLRVQECNGVGLLAGGGGLVRDCTAYLNGAGYSVGAGSRVADCTAFDSDGDGFFAVAEANFSGCIARDCGNDGFNVGDGSTLNNCAARNNGRDGFMGVDGVAFTDCVAQENDDDGFQVNNLCTLTNCVSFENGGDGITAAAFCLIQHCNVTDSVLNGIAVLDGCRILNNHCNSNGNGIGNPGSGVLVQGTDNAIDGNQLFFNGRGIDLFDNGNFIVRNVAGSSTGTGNPSAEYDFNGFNTQTYGELQNFIGGQITSGSGAWVNFRLLN